MKKLIVACTLAFALLTITGCATKKINWSGRVGHYHYDQAVTELGPPDKSAKLTDGTTIAEWYQSKDSRFSFGLGMGVGTGPVGVGVGVPLGGDQVEVLRLTFDQQGILQSTSGSANDGKHLSEPAGAANGVK